MSSTPALHAESSISGPRTDAVEKQPGYSPLFGLPRRAGEERPLPPWLPVSLLAVTTAALAVSVVFLRRQRAAAAAVGGARLQPLRRNGTAPAARRSVSTSSAAPPPRYGASSGAPPPRSSLASRAPPPPRSAPPSRAPHSPRIPIKTGAVVVDRASVTQGEASAGGDFNTAFYSAKAFGIATLLVGAGAVTAVWGVQQALGVQNTKEFAHRMRSFMLYRMQFLSSRIHRPPAPENGDSDAPRLRVDQSSGAVEWSWPDAERRLKTAYEEEGIMGWAEAALRELEAEGELERSKRGHA